MHVQSVAPFLAVLLGTLWFAVPVDGATCDVDTLSDSSNLATCLSQVQTGAVGLPDTVLTAANTLSVYIDAVFCTPDKEIQACCDVICAESGSFRLNPLKKDKPDNYLLRRKPNLKFYIKDGANVAVGGDDLFTLMLLDLQNGPWIHWLQMDIPGLTKGSGTEVVTYFTPVISRSTHLLLLFRQTKAYADDLNNYAQSKDTATDEKFKAFCSSEPRCAFNFAGFVQNYGLEVLGATWVSPSDTNFTLVMRQDKLGFTFAQACEDQLQDGSCPAPLVTTDNKDCKFDPSEDVQKVCKEAYDKADYKGEELEISNGAGGHPSILWGLMSPFLVFIASRVIMMY